MQSYMLDIHVSTIYTSVKNRAIIPRII